MESNFNQQKSLDQLKKDKLKRMMMAAMAGVTISSATPDESEARGRGGNFQAPMQRFSPPPQPRYFAPPQQRYFAPPPQRFAPQPRYFAPPPQRFVSPPQQRFIPPSQQRYIAPAPQPRFIPQPTPQPRFVPQPPPRPKFVPSPQPSQPTFQQIPQKLIPSQPQSAPSPQSRDRIIVPSPQPKFVPPPRPGFVPQPVPQPSQPGFQQIPQILIPKSEFVPRFLPSKPKQEPEPQAQQKLTPQLPQQKTTPQAAPQPVQPDAKPKSRLQIYLEQKSSQPATKPKDTSPQPNLSQEKPKSNSLIRRKAGSEQAPLTEKQKDFLKPNNSSAFPNTANSTLQQQRPPTNEEVRAAMSATKEGMKNNPTFLAGTGYELANKQAFEMITPALQKAGIDVTKINNIYFKMGQEVGGKASTAVDVAMLYTGVGEAKFAVIGGIKLIKGANGALKVADAVKGAEALSVINSVKHIPETIKGIDMTRKIVGDLKVGDKLVDISSRLGKEIQQELLHGVENSKVKRYVEQIYRTGDTKPGGSIGEALRELEAAKKNLNIISPTTLTHYTKISQRISGANNILKEQKELNLYEKELVGMLRRSLEITKKTIDMHFTNK
jgi:hypothetical protein